MKKVFTLSFVLLGIIFFASCTKQTNQNTNINTNQTAVQVQDIVSTESLSYSTTGIDVSFVKTSATFDLPAKQLKDAAAECGSQHADDYFDQLVLKFSGTEITHYNFTYKGDSQGSDTYRVMLIPNIPGYISLDEFKKDFDICAAGGGSYPIMLNNDWLVFESSCGSGLDDGSGKPIGCQEVKDVVEPTLMLSSDSSTEIVELRKIENDLSASLQREYADENSPTYTEFITTVSTISNSLNIAVANLETKYKNKVVSESITTDIAELKVVANDLQMSVKRGDAELAPTYVEFYNTVKNIQQDLEQVVAKIELEKI